MGYITLQSRAEQSRAEQSRAEQSRAEQSRAEQSRAAFILSVFISVGLLYFIAPSWRTHALITGTLISTVLIYLTVSRARYQQPIKIIFFLAIAAFSLTVGIRFFLFSIYKMEPRSLLIIQALSNTKTSEITSYIRQNLVIIIFSISVAIAFFAATVYAARRARIFFLEPASNRRKYTLYIATILGVVIHLNPAFRRENPPFYWARAYTDYNNWIKELSKIQDMRKAAMAEIDQWNPTLRNNKPSTFVFVIGESQNRNNLSLYGYPRNTTPEFNKLRDKICAFRNVYSYSAATTPAFIDMLTSTINKKNGEWWTNPTLPMLAKAAGYKMYWISNQNDRFIEATFAKDFDVYKQINIGGGREDVSLDENLLSYVREAINDMSEKKFIVVHLIGSHPHYDLRYTEKYNVFSSDKNPVNNLSTSSVILPWVRTARNHYDNSILYTDYVLSQIVKILDNDKNINRSLLYLSDHSNDVGHESAFVGHAPTKKSGYEIPFIYYGNRQSDCLQSEGIEYQTDRLIWTLLDILDIDVSFGERDHGSILSQKYDIKPIKKRWN
jgi:heptose-I-phosphate ethanolaminephosphotransferase